MTAQPSAEQLAATKAIFEAAGVAVPVFVSTKATRHRNHDGARIYRTDTFRNADGSIELVQFWYYSNGELSHISSLKS